MISPPVPSCSSDVPPTVKVGRNWSFIVTGQNKTAAGGLPAAASYRVLRVGCLPEVVFLDFSAAHDHVVHFIGTIGKAQVAHVGVHARQRRPL